LTGQVPNDQCEACSAGRRTAPSSRTAASVPTAASVRFFGSVGRHAGGFAASAAGGGNCLADPRKTTK